MSLCFVFWNISRVCTRGVVPVPTLSHLLSFLITGDRIRLAQFNGLARHMVGCVALHMCRGILVSKAQGQEMKIVWSTNIKNPGVAFNSALKFLYVGYF